jgi:hypothetical protein
MPCDERYRMWAMRQAPAADGTPPELYPARLIRVTECPAQQGYRELKFDVADTEWSWCFPGPGQADGRNHQVRLLIFRSGAHGLTVQAVTGQGGGMTQPAMFDLAAVADLAISAVPVFIHCCLLRRETGPTSAAPQPVEPGRR